MKQALRYFLEATGKAPAYAPAQAALGHAYFLFAQPFAGTIDLSPRTALEQSKAAASRAVAIDEGLAEAHAVLGLARWLHDSDWRGGEEEFRRAISLDVNSVDAHNYFAIFLAASGRHAEAMAELTRAIELDPLNLRLRTLRGELLTYEGRFDDAIREAHQVLALNPSYARPHFYLAGAYEGTGQAANAVAEHLIFLKAMGLSDESAAVLRRAFEKGGLHGFYRQRLRFVEETRKRRYVRPTDVAEMYAHLGDNDAAFRCLYQAFQEHDSELMFAGSNPALRSLRSDPRFADLLRRIGYPGSLQ